LSVYSYCKLSDWIITFAEIGLTATYLLGKDA